MLSLRYHISVHLMTGMFLVYEGDYYDPHTWRLRDTFSSMHDAEEKIDQWQAEDDERIRRELENIEVRNG